MATLKVSADICTRVMAIVALLVALIKPLRERVLGVTASKAGVRCLLRSDMLHTYYKHKDENKIRQYELENFMHLYNAYKEMGGNSFIDKIKHEVDEGGVVA